MNKSILKKKKALIRKTIILHNDLTKEGLYKSANKMHDVVRVINGEVTEIQSREKEGEE